MNEHSSNQNAAIAMDPEHDHSTAPSGRDGHDSHAQHGVHRNGHGGHGDHVGQFRRLFWIMLVVAVPVVGFSPMFATLLGYGLPDGGSWRWISPVLGTVMYGWGGRPFLTGAVSELRSRKPGMMLLIALAITVAFMASWGSSTGILDHELDFWWELAQLIVIMLLGHWIEMRSLAQTTPHWTRWQRCCRMRPNASTGISSSPSHLPNYRSVTW
jgi:Cu2+-exporting ATPase